jgi:hypothetical protein
MIRPWGSEAGKSQAMRASSPGGVVDSEWYISTRAGRLPGAGQRHHRGHHGQPEALRSSPQKDGAGAFPSQRPLIALLSMGTR